MMQTVTSQVAQHLCSSVSFHLKQINPLIDIDPTVLMRLVTTAPSPGDASSAPNHQSFVGLNGDSSIDANKTHFEVLWAGFDKLECEGGTTRQGKQEQSEELGELIEVNIQDVLEKRKEGVKLMDELSGKKIDGVGRQWRVKGKGVDATAAGSTEGCVQEDGLLCELQGRDSGTEEEWKAVSGKRAGGRGGQSL
ncbi:hypothetical protein Dimus_002989 [Dionaea muscipula]